MVRFVIDAFGGDNAPAAIIDGCIEAIESHDDISITLCGNEDILRHDLARRIYDRSRLCIVHAPDIISCDESPTLAIKRKKNSSLVTGLRILADKEADCFISAGSTGAVLAGATFIVKRIPGVKRPALAPILPTIKGPAMLIDCGANVDCKSEYLEQFALMGTSYMNCVVGLSTPRVALINNGTEEGKGNELAKQTFPLLKANEHINFIGNCEARDIMSGDYDVLVCDGFVGNVALKSMEGAVAALMKLLKNEISSKKRSKFGALFCRNAFRELKKRMDYTEYGGAPLLGVNGCIIKAHGSSDAHAIASAIGQGRKLFLGGITEKIASKIPAAEDSE